MKKYFSIAIIGTSLSLGMMGVNTSYAEVSTEKTSKTIKIVANLKGTVKYQKGGTQQEVPAILTFGESHGGKSLMITDFEKTPSISRDELKNIAKNTGGYKLTNDNGDPMKYAEAVAKKIPGVKEGGGYAHLNGLRIRVTVLVLGADGKTPVPSTEWIGVDNLEKIIIKNPTKNATGGFDRSLKVIYNTPPAA